MKGLSWAVLIALVVALIFFAVPAFAQMACGESKVMTSILKEEHKEQVTGHGQGASGAFVQLYTSEKGKTFSVVVLLPEGIACILISGDDWERLDFQPETQSH